MVFANKLCKIKNTLDKWGATRGTTRLPPFYQRGLGNSSIAKNTISKSPLISLFRGQHFGCPPFSPSKIVHSTWNPLKQMDPKNHVWSNPQRDPSRSQVPVFLLESKPWVEQIIKLIKATDHKVRQVMAIGKVYNNVLFVETKSNIIRSFQR